MHDRVAPLVQEAFAHLQNDVFCALPPAYPEEVAARQIGGYARGFLPTHSRSCPLSRPWLRSNATRPTVFLCSGARGVMSGSAASRVHAFVSAGCLQC